RVDFEREQIADCVLILGAREPPERCRSSGIRPGGRCPVERGLERADRGIVRRGVRSRQPDRRHLTRADLADDFLPGVGMCGDVLPNDPVEGQAAALQALVVARHAVAVDECPDGRIGIRSGGPWLLRGEVKGAGGCEEDRGAAPHRAPSGIEHSLLPRESYARPLWTQNTGASRAEALKTGDLRDTASARDRDCGRSSSPAARRGRYGARAASAPRAATHGSCSLPAVPWFPPRRA